MAVGLAATAIGEKRAVADEMDGGVAEAAVWVVLKDLMLRP